MKIESKTLDDIDKKIIEHLSAGYKQSDIAGKVWLSKKAIYHRVYMMRQYFKCKTTTELVNHIYNTILREEV